MHFCYSHINALCSVIVRSHNNESYQWYTGRASITLTFIDNKSRIIFLIVFSDASPRRLLLFLGTNAKSRKKKFPPLLEEDWIIHKLYRHFSRDCKGSRHKLGSLPFRVGIRHNLLAKQPAKTFLWKDIIGIGATGEVRSSWDMASSTSSQLDSCRWEPMGLPSLFFFLLSLSLASLPIHTSGKAVFPFFLTYVLRNIAAAWASMFSSNKISTMMRWWHAWSWWSRLRKPWWVCKSLL